MWCGPCEGRTGQPDKARPTKDKGPGAILALVLYVRVYGRCRKYHRATGVTMNRIMRGMATVLLGTAAAAVFVTTIYGQAGQSIMGKPSPANHYIETPEGWVHPKTP